MNRQSKGKKGKKHADEYNESFYCVEEESEDEEEEVERNGVRSHTVTHHTTSTTVQQTTTGKKKVDIRDLLGDAAARDSLPQSHSSRLAESKPIVNRQETIKASTAQRVSPSAAAQRAVPATSRQASVQAASQNVRGFQPGSQANHARQDVRSANRHELFGKLTPNEVMEMDELYGLDKLLQVMEMGFPPHHARIALKLYKGNVEAAVAFCVSRPQEDIEAFIKRDAESPTKPATNKSPVPANNAPRPGLFAAAMGASTRGAIPSPSRQMQSASPQNAVAASRAQQQTTYQTQTGHTVVRAQHIQQTSTVQVQARQVVQATQVVQQAPVQQQLPVRSQPTAAPAGNITTSQPPTPTNAQPGKASAPPVASVHIDKRVVVAALETESEYGEIMDYSPENKRNTNSNRFSATSEYGSIMEFDLDDLEEEPVQYYEAKVKAKEALKQEHDDDDSDTEYGEVMNVQSIIKEKVVVQETHNELKMVHQESLEESDEEIINDVDAIFDAVEDKGSGPTVYKVASEDNERGELEKQVTTNTNYTVESEEEIIDDVDAIFDAVEDKGSGPTVYKVYSSEDEVDANANEIAVESETEHQEKHLNTVENVKNEDIPLTEERKPGILLVGELVEEVDMNHLNVEISEESPNVDTPSAAQEVNSGLQDEDVVDTHMPEETRPISYISEYTLEPEEQTEEEAEADNGIIVHGEAAIISQPVQSESATIAEESQPVRQENDVIETIVEAPRESESSSNSSQSEFTIADDTSREGGEFSSNEVSARDLTANYRLSARTGLDSDQVSTISGSDYAESSSGIAAFDFHEEEHHVINVEASSIVADLTAPITPFLRRKYLPFTCENIGNGKWKAEISLHQTKLKKGEPTPQGSRQAKLMLGTCTSKDVCQDLCESYAPPVWSGKKDSNECVLCNTKFTMFNAAHHCRNCGYLVCGNCSDKLWPGTMIPSTYHDDEKVVRVCHSCHYLAEKFAQALRTGDFNEALLIYSSGNVNLHQPYSMYTNAAYPIHMAASGGNLDLLKWLLDTKKCSLKNGKTGKPIVTASGLSVLAVAAQCGYVDIINYLVHKKKCSVTEIKDPIVLQRALHAVLKAPGPLPEIPLVKGKPIPDDILFGTKSNIAEPSNSAASAIPVATGAFEAQVIVSHIEQAPAFVNQHHVTATALSPNGITNCQLSKQANNKYLCTQSVLLVNDYIEKQRHAVGLTTQVTHLTANTVSPTASSSPHHHPPLPPSSHHNRTLQLAPLHSHQHQTHHTMRNAQSIECIFFDSTVNSNR